MGCGAIFFVTGASFGVRSKIGMGSILLHIQYLGKRVKISGFRNFAPLSEFYSTFRNLLRLSRMWNNQISESGAIIGMWSKIGKGSKIGKTDQNF